MMGPTLGGVFSFFLFFSVNEISDCHGIDELSKSRPALLRCLARLLACLLLDYELVGSSEKSETDRGEWTRES